MPGEPITVELFVRSLSPAGARDRPSTLVDRLEALAEAERIDDYSVFVWGREVPLSTEAGYEHAELVLDRLGEFRSWAAERDATLDGIELREASTLTEKRYTALSLPMSALAEYADGRLVCVAPCTTDHGSLTVEERLDRLDTPAENAEASPPLAQKRRP